MQKERQRIFEVEHTGFIGIAPLLWHSVAQMIALYYSVDMMCAWFTVNYKLQTCRVGTHCDLDFAHISLTQRDHIKQQTSQLFASAHSNSHRMPSAGDRFTELAKQRKTCKAECVCQPHLMSPYHHFSGVTLKNRASQLMFPHAANVFDAECGRVIMAPMTRGRSGHERIPNEMNFEYYTARADAGMIITEGVSFSPYSHGWAQSAAIETDEQMAAWKKIVDAVQVASCAFSCGTQVKLSSVRLDAVSLSSAVAYAS
eukprot:7317-Heterococcus_DN1.PRE.11